MSSPDSQRDAWRTQKVKNSDLSSVLCKYFCVSNRHANPWRWALVPVIAPRCEEEEAEVPGGSGDFPSWVQCADCLACGSVPVSSAPFSSRSLLPTPMEGAGGCRARIRAEVPLMRGRRAIREADEQGGLSAPPAAAGTVQVVGRLGFGPSVVIHAPRCCQELWLLFCEMSVGPWSRESPQGFLWPAFPGSPEDSVKSMCSIPSSLKYPEGIQSSPNYLTIMARSKWAESKRQNSLSVRK